MKTTSLLRAALGVSALCLTLSAQAVSQSDFDRADALWAQNREAEALQLLQKAVDAEPPVRAGEGSASLTQGYWLLAKAKLKIKPQRLEESARDFLKARMLGFERQHPERSMDVTLVGRRYAQLLGQEPLLRLQVEVAQSLNPPQGNSAPTSLAVTTLVLPRGNAGPAPALTAPPVDAQEPSVVRASDPTSTAPISQRVSSEVNLSETTVAWARGVDKLMTQVPLLPALKEFVLGKDADKAIEQYALFYLMVSLSLLLAVFRAVLAVPRLLGETLASSSKHVGTVNNGVGGMRKLSPLSVGEGVVSGVPPSTDTGGFKNVTRASAAQRKSWR